MRWTDDMKDYVRDNSAFLHDEEIALNLTLATGHPVTVAMVRRQRSILKIRKRPGRGVRGLNRGGR